MSYNTKIAGLCFGLALGLAAVGQSAVAAQAASSDTAFVKVAVGDVNPASPDGAKILLGRFHAAAETICGPGPDRDLHRADLYRRCLRSTVDGAVASFDSSMVTAMYGGKSQPTQLAQAH